jgi:hypothetical protein
MALNGLLCRSEANYLAGAFSRLLPRYQFNLPAVLRAVAMPPDVVWCACPCFILRALHKKKN